MEPGPLSAMCASHPTVAATRTCERCGNFMCHACSVEGTQGKCPHCRELVGDGAFPFDRATFSFDQLWSYVLEKWKAEWVMLSVAVLVMIGATFAVGLVTNILQAILSAVLGAGSKDGEDAFMGVIVAVVIAQLIGLVLRLAVDGIFQLGLVRIALDVLNGKKADIGRLVSQVSKVPRYVGQLLLVSLGMMIPAVAVFGAALLIGLNMAGLSLGELDSFSALDNAFEESGKYLITSIVVAGLLLAVPYFYFGLPLLFMNAELVYGNASPIETIRRCYVIARGLRFPIFGYFLMVILVVFLGVLACCIGVLPAAGFAQLLLCSLYLAARKGTGLPEAPEP